MIKKVHNPDVLTCIANLSSDEVFTPPSVVNQMLDSLPKELWSNEKTTFLDPVSKSGVFLREITKRLIDGLESKIPNLENRIEHILHYQVFGIGITELTSLISRRSLYCSKYANGKYSIVQFDDEQGNLKYFKAEHVWEGGVCRYCGVSKEIYDRGDELENYAYSFIHSDNPLKLFNMKFDVIVGNPPYQMSDGGGGGSATPLYHKFIDTAKKLNPRFLTMIIPSRWFSGGRGLDSFREEMLKDRRISKLVDFPLSSDCFPGVEIKGGVCYFLWEKDYNDKCNVVTFRNGESDSYLRYLNQFGDNLFIRFNNSISILEKVLKLKEPSFSKVVSNQKPFGLRTFERGSTVPSTGKIELFTNKGVQYVSKEKVTKNPHWINEFKIFITMAYGAGEDFPHQIINKPLLGGKDSCCTETYLVIGPFSSLERTNNVISYIKTKFFRFCVLQIKNTQHASKSVYRFVPEQNFDEEWTDEKLYKKYDLNKEEIEFIESMIRPME